MNKTLIAVSVVAAVALSGCASVTKQGVGGALVGAGLESVVSGRYEDLGTKAVVATGAAAIAGTKTFGGGALAGGAAAIGVEAMSRQNLQNELHRVIQSERTAYQNFMGTYQRYISALPAGNEPVSEQRAIFLARSAQQIDIAFSDMKAQADSVGKILSAASRNPDSSVTQALQAHNQMASQVDQIYRNYRGTLDEAGKSKLKITKELFGNGYTQSLY